MTRAEAFATAPDVTAHILVCLVALGMALAFISADRESPTSRWLALTFAFIGNGKRLFKEGVDLKRLTLTSNTTTRSGVAIMTYTPRR